MKRAKLCLPLIIVSLALLSACAAPQAATPEETAEDVTVVYLGIGDS